MLAAAGAVYPVAAQDRRASEAAAVGERDVVLVLDGSSSMDGNEWNLLREGYAQAASDPLVVPQDGSMAIGVVQFSGTSTDHGTRLEIPLTPITDQASADKVANRIKAIQQLGSDTNTGDGIAAAAKHAQEAGRPGATQSLCASPEGTVNAGVGMGEAYVDAVDKRGVEEIGYVALTTEVPEAEMRAAYGPYVHGGRNFQAARSLPQFTERAYACFLPELRLGAIEVNQAVQNWANEVPLVAGKDTIVRVFPETKHAGRIVNTTGRLRGYRDGRELPGSPLNTVQPDRAVGVAPDAAAVDRSRPSTSLNFRLPDSWTKGELTLVPDLPGPLECGTPDCKTTVRFKDTGTLRFRTKAGTWKENGKQVAPTHAEITEQVARIGDAMPASRVHNTGTSLFGMLGPPGGQLELMTANQVAASSPYERGTTLTILPGYARTGDPTGISDPFGAPAAIGFIQNQGAWDAAGDYRNTLPHEVGHLNGLEHSVNQPNQAGGKKGPCKETAGDDTPDYPFWFEPAGLNQPRAALGPMPSNPSYQMWGAVPRYFGTSAQDMLAIVDPNEVFSLMGYCPPTDPHTQGEWIGSSDYRKVLDRGFETADREKGSAAAADLVLSGSIDTKADKAAFDPLQAALGAPVTDDDPDGTHELRLLNEDGDLVHRVRFTPPAPVSETPDDEPATLTGFRVAAADPDGRAVRAELVHDGDVIGTLTNGADSDQAVKVDNVEMRTSGGGSGSDPDQLEITWQGNTGQDTKPTYAVQYSPDDGKTWHSVAGGITDTSVTVARWALPGGTRARARVIASHGLSLGQGTSPATDIPIPQPQLTVDGPKNGAVFTGAQNIVFSASAYDAGLGELDGDAITWESDLTGKVGTGRRLQIDADQLGVGEHRITVTAKAEGGDYITRSIDVSVRALPRTGN